MKKFSEDETRFPKPIKKIKIANFAISKFEKKKKHKRNHKLQAFKAQEIGFFGRVLHLSVVSGMYLEKIFEYYILSHHVSHIQAENAVIHHYMVKDQNF